MIRLQFPSEREAIDYAKEHGISLDRIELPSKDEYCYIEVEKLPKEIQSRPTRRKSSIASKLGDYSGVGYITQINWEHLRFDTGKSSPKMTSDFREARVFFSRKGAERATLFPTAKRIIREVEIKNGKIIKLRSHQN